MSDIDPKNVTHNIVLILDAKLMKQKNSKKNPKITFLVKDKIEKHLDASFIHSMDYSPWIRRLECTLIFEISIKIL